MAEEYNPEYSIKDQVSAILFRKFVFKQVDESIGYSKVDADTLNAALISMLIFHIAHLENRIKELEKKANGND